MTPTSSQTRLAGTARAPASARKFLKDRAYSELKEMIQTGVFPPNTFLSERQLVERLGMSKTPIRSALEHLESQGLVVVSPQQGIVVKELSAQEIADLFDMRSAVEPFIVSQLAERRLGADGVASVQANLRLQARAAAAGDAPGSTRLDIEFHTLLAQLLDNREAIAWLSRCFDKLHRSIMRINRLSVGRLEKSQQDHATIARLIIAGKADAAARRMMDHLRYGRGFLQNASN
jgi:DNA-binding GntR family transcriptional regulator